MDASQAIKILQAVADGVDPHTGEVFRPDSPYQRPQVIRALFFAIRQIEDVEANSKRKKLKRNLPENAGKPWYAKEDELLCQRFDAGINISQLAREHMRTRGSIQARLVKLGKIDMQYMADMAVADKRYEKE